MSDTTSTTPAEGSAALTVDDAASAFLGLMGSDEGSEDGQPEAQAAQETEEAQGEDESYDEAEADEQDEGEEVEQPKYRVKAAGEEREVTLDELIKSYQLGQDYTKKSQMVAEERKAIEAEKAAVAEAKQLRDQYAQRLQAMEQVLSAQMPSEDLESLKDTDPIGYAVKVAEMSQREKQLAAVRAEQERIAQQQEADRIGQLQQVVAQEAQKLAEAIPELSDAEKGAAIKRDIREFGKKLGFSDAELASVYDSRAVLTLYKAMQYDRLIASKATKQVTEAPRVLKAGVATSRSEGEAQVVKKLKSQARQSGRIADAAALFERML